MENLQSFQLPALVDMLSEQTTYYINMLREGGSEDDFQNCKQLIAALQKEIEYRSLGTSVISGNME